MPSSAPVLDTKRGKQILMLLLAVAFLDFVDVSIVNVACPRFAPISGSLSGAFSGCSPATC